jgi:hypothetical protein
VEDIEPLIEPVTIAVGRRDVATIGAFMVAAYETHSSAIYGMALGSTRDPELAADVTQEAFLHLLTEAQRGRAPDNVGGWLYRAASNLIVSRARRAAVARRFAPRLLRTIRTGSATRASGRGVRLDVDQAIRAMRHRDICPLEVVPGVPGARHDDAITVDDSVHGPGIERRLRFGFRTIQQLDRIATTGLSLDDHGVIVVDPDKRLASPRDVAISCSLCRHHGSSAIELRMPAEQASREGRMAASGGPDGTSDANQLPRSLLPPPRRRAM